MRGFFAILFVAFLLVFTSIASAMSGGTTDANRGIVQWTPGNIPPGTCVTNTIAISAAVADADCLLTIPRPGLGQTAIIPSCSVKAGECDIMLCNSGGTLQSGSTGQYACRVF